jgi:threonine dehydrogenase-like Zn-dependent dehydrogenase
VPKGPSLFDARVAELLAIGMQASRLGMISDRNSVLVLDAGPIGLALVEISSAGTRRLCVHHPTWLRSGSTLPPTSGTLRFCFNEAPSVFDRFANPGKSLHKAIFLKEHV